jgi:predicted TIM-barrel fold metal-dependent hydrolase
MTNWDCYAHIGAHRGIEARSLLADMDRCGIGRAALIPFLDAPGFDDLLQAARDWPDRFIAACRLDPGPRGDFGALLARGFCGARLVLPAPGQREDDLAPALAALDQRAAVLVAHAPGGAGRHADQLVAWAGRYPRLRVFVPHLGWPLTAQGAPTPDWDSGIRRLARCDRIYAGLSALYFFSRQPPPFEDAFVFARAVLDAFGPRRCVLAGDYPMTLDRCAYDQVWESLRAAVGDEAHMRRMRAETPLRLWAAEQA